MNRWLRQIQFCSCLFVLLPPFGWRRSPKSHTKKNKKQQHSKLNRWPSFFIIHFIWLDEWQFLFFNPRNLFLKSGKFLEDCPTPKEERTQIHMKKKKNKRQTSRMGGGIKKRGERDDYCCSTLGPTDALVELNNKNGRLWWGGNCDGANMI